MFNKVLDKLATWFKSERFFRFVIAFFVFESMWIALSAVYPQAFDEDFHFGIIKIYAHHWLPFLSSQPANANAYGAVFRDPSFLYHYLMSFPYRLIEVFIHGQTGQVIALRLINIALFAFGLVLFRRLLLKLRISRSIAHVFLLLFTLIPVVPLLAAQINYDNLLFLLVAWICLLGFDGIDQVRQKKISARTFLILFVGCLFTTLVKYAFLPIFFGLVIFFLVYVYMRYNLIKFLKAFWQSFIAEKWLPKLLLILAVVISLGLFIQRDVGNVVRYHQVAPDCAKVMSVQACSAYSVWNFNYYNHINVASRTVAVSHNIVYYLAQWMYWMWYRLFFAVNGPNSSFTNYPPLPIPAALGIIMFIAGLFVVIKWRRRLLYNNPYLLLLGVISLFYILALLFQGYYTYNYTAVLENMNGRYLLPVLPLVAALVAKAISLAVKSPHTKIVLSIGAIILFLQGGGFLTFISRSDPSWYWPNNAVVRVNDTARSITEPFIIKGSKTYQSRIWFFN